jgi:hypothetical protein
MKKRKMSVDPASYALAEHFLSETSGVLPEDTQELAEVIQKICEDFVSAIEEDEAGKTP